MGQKISFVRAKCSSELNDDNTDLENPELISKTENEYQPSKPLSMEHLHQSVQTIFPNVFEGLKATIHAPSMPMISCSHTLAFGDEKQSGYKLGATHIWPNANSEPNVMAGEISPNGNLDTAIVYQFFKNFRVRYNWQLKMNKEDSQQLACEYKQSNLNLGVTVINPSIMKKEIFLVLDLMRKITSKFSLGSMLQIQKSSHSPIACAIWDLGGEYTGENWSTSVSLKPLHNMFQCTYIKKIPNSTLQIGTEVTSNFANRTCVAATGYQFQSIGGSIIRYKIDTNWKVGSSYEFKSQKFPIGITFSLHGDLWKSVYGVGLEFSNSQ